MDIPGYQIVRELGRGGMATVYLAVQDTLNRQVALKVIKPELTTDVGFRERCAREGRIVARFRHPGIVTVYDFWKRDSALLLSMEYLPGGTLAERVERGLPKVRVLEMVAMMADALAYAHRNDVVHRDVKPTNILFREDDTPVLTDFGIARLLDESTRLTQPGLSIGSPRYMSPEQVLGQAVDFRSDIYSLGIVFYEMLTGDAPWSDTGNPIMAALRHCTAPIPRLPPRLIEYQPILEKLLAKNPDDRYQDASSFAEDLRRLARDDRAPRDLEPTKIIQPRARVPKMCRRTWRRPVAATLVLLGVVGLGIGAYQLPGDLSRDEDTETGLRIVLPPPAEDRPLEGKVEELAIGLLQTRDYEQSLDLIRGGLKRSPKDERLLVLEDIVENRWTATRHLQAASDYFRSGMLDNAAQELKDGLNVLESHPQLLALRDDVAAALLGFAERNFDAGDLESSRARIGQGLWLMPNHPGLLSLRDRVEQRIADQARADELLAEATRVEGKERWQEALTVIEEAIALAPGYPELASAKQRVEKNLLRFRAAQAESLHTEARKLLDRGELASSQRLIRNGLELAPDHPGLRALRVQVQKTITRREKAAGLLAKARDSYAEGDYSASGKLLDEGPRLVPDPPDLLDWKKRIEAQIEEENLRQAKGLLRQATALAGKGKLADALAMAERGLVLAPEDSGLQTLKEEVRGELDRRAERERRGESLVGDARARLGAGELEEAAASARKALELKPDHAQTKDLLVEAERRIAQLKAHGRARELLFQAQRDFEAGRVGEARSLVKSGHELAPKDKELIALEVAIGNRVELGQTTAELVVIAGAKADSGAFEEALAALKRALQLDPNNQRARDLRERVDTDVERRQEAANLLAEAQELREAGALDKSLASIDAGLDLIPDHPPLLAVRNQVQQALSAEKQRKVDAERAGELLGQARAALDLANLDEARNLATEGLALAPDNPALTGLLQNVKERRARAQVREREAAQRVTKLREQAQVEEQRGNEEESLRLLRDPLALDADDTRLVAEELRMRAILEKKEEADSLLADCDAHFTNKAYTTPVGNKPGTALDCYRKILKLDPDNARAIAGITRIADTYAQWASAKIDRRNPSKARKHLESLESVDPQYPKLDELRKRLAEMERSPVHGHVARTRGQPTKHGPTAKSRPSSVPAPTPPVARKEEKMQTVPSTPASTQPKRVFGTF